MNTTSDLLKMMTEGVTATAEFAGVTYTFVSPKTSDFMKLYSEDKKEREAGVVDMVIDCTRDINGDKIFNATHKEKLRDDRSGFVDFASDQIMELRKKVMGISMEENKKN